MAISQRAQRMARRRHRARNGESSEDDEGPSPRAGPSSSERAMAQAQRNAQRRAERAEDNGGESSEDNVNAPRLRLPDDNPQPRPTREEYLRKISVNARAIVSELFSQFNENEGYDEMKRTLEARLQADEHGTTLTDIQREVSNNWRPEHHQRYLYFYEIMQRIITDLTPPPPLPRAPPTPPSSPRVDLMPKLRV